jgi:hypothetical protein
MGGGSGGAPASGVGGADGGVAAAATGGGKCTCDAGARAAVRMWAQAHAMRRAKAGRGSHLEPNGAYAHVLLASGSEGEFTRRDVQRGSLLQPAHGGAQHVRTEQRDAQRAGCLVAATQCAVTACTQRWLFAVDGDERDGAHVQIALRRTGHAPSVSMRTRTARSDAAFAGAVA